MMDDKELRLKIAEANNWDIAKAIEVCTFVNGGEAVSGLQVELFKTDKGVAIKSNLCPTFVVSLHDATKEPVELCREYPVGNKYYKREVDAIFDYNGKSNTAALPLNEEIKLKDGEYIPSLGQLVLMSKVKDKLNRMLIKCGGDALNKDDNHWSSTEYASAYAWFLYFSDGNVGRYGHKVMGSSRVRPVSAF